MLHKNICFVALTLALASCSGSKHGHKKVNAMPGTWQATPIEIDGDSKDWPSPYPNYDAKAFIGYATSNDKENLYITMESGDEISQIKILKQGMVVSIDTSGGKSPSFSIDFPLQNDNEPLELPKDIHNPESREFLHVGASLDKQIDKAESAANQFVLEGFGACNGGYLVSQTSPCGVKVRAHIDEYKELIWEAVIPFKVLYGKDQITQADMGKLISVCYSIKGFKKEIKNTDNANSGMNQGGGGQGMVGGRANMPSTRNAARMAMDNPMDHLYESTKTWKVFTIAYQP